MENKYKESFVRDTINYLQCFVGNQLAISAVACCADGLELTGMVGRAAERSIVPVVYLEDITGRASAEKAACIIAGKFRAMLSGIPVKQGRPYPKTERGNVLKNVILRAASKQRSRLLLRDSAYFCHLDLAGFFYLPSSNRYLSTQQMKDLQLTVDELQAAACQNTLSRFGITLANTTEYSNSFPEGTILQSEPFASITFNPQGLYLLTNEAPEGGAALMLMPPVLEMLGAMAGGNFYITPKSTREVLISSEKSMFSPLTLTRLLRMGNRKLEETQPESFLSNHIYQYVQKEKKLMTVQL